MDIASGNGQTFTPFNDEEFKHDYVTQFGDTHFIDAFSVEAYINSKRNDMPVSGEAIITDLATSYGISKVIYEAVEKGVDHYIKDAILSGALLNVIGAIGFIDEALGYLGIGPSAMAETCIRKAILNNLSYDKEQWHSTRLKISQFDATY